MAGVAAGATPAVPWKSVSSVKLVPFVFTDAGIPRAGNPVLDTDGNPVGEVTSGSLSPCMEVGIGMAYVRSDLAQPGTELVVDVRGKHRAALVESKPLYKKES